MARNVVPHCAIYENGETLSVTKEALSHLGGRPNPRKIGEHCDEPNPRPPKKSPAKAGL